MHPVGIPCAKLRTKFEVSSSNSFEDTSNRLPKNLGSRDLSHTPFGENFLCARSAFPRQSYVPNLKSVSQVVLKICSIVCQKFEGSRDLNHAPLGKNYLCACSGFPRRSRVQNLKFVA